jgi:hypothetical protein
MCSNIFLRTSAWTIPRSKARIQVTVEAESLILSSDGAVSEISSPIWIRRINFGKKQFYYKQFRRNLVYVPLVLFHCRYGVYI